ncbi:MAG: DUF1566 domain-containing protein [Saprospiraceae bacterium]
MKLFIALIILLSTPNINIGQGVSISASATPPDPSAILDIKSTTKGLLIPRMTMVQRNLIVSPALGLIIFQIDNMPGLYYYNGVSWTPVNIPSMADHWVTIDSNIVNTNAGSVIVNTSLSLSETNTPADPSAVLDIQSVTKGFLPPRITISERNAMVSPAAGLMIWCNDCGVYGEIQVSNGIEWTNSTGGSRADIAVGDVYFGGIVAYILQPTDPGYTPGEIHGLIAAPEDQSSVAIWGCPFSNLPGTKSVLMGTGYKNTLEIVNECSAAGIAARVCNDLVLGGYSDWYLPSRDDLSKLYINRDAIGGFAVAAYWSSSDYGAPTDNAWYVAFDLGYASNIEKFVFFKVRAVRSF